MNRLSDNYYHRKCYLERDQVPTQSIIKEKMSEPLANIYFKNMPERQKVYVGLEPPLKGAGPNWYMPPEEQLAGRAVLKPVEKKHLAELTTGCIKDIGEKLKNERYQSMLAEMQNGLLQSDQDWKSKVVVSNSKYYTEQGNKEATSITKNVLESLNHFEKLYVTSIIKLEKSISIAAYKEIERIREDVHQDMKQRFKMQLKYQAIQIQKKYQNCLNKKKDEMKEEFVTKVENMRGDTAKQIHDSNYDKHLAIEKLRHFLQCQNLACQVYIAMKEKEAYEKELELSKHQHKKTIKSLEKEILMIDVAIKREMEQQKKCREFDDNWKNKVCHVVKKFQLFVEYCLKQLPQYAEFFVNVEKLMLLHLSEALDEPEIESSIVKPEKDHETPEPRPRPFYLFCDTGHKTDINWNLCPKNVTSSSSQLPVIVINKRCIYSACDNFKMFTKKIAQYVERNGNDDSMEDSITKDEYDLKVPIKYTSFMHLLELKLESSLMQLIQQELPNTRDLPLNCTYCKIPFCFCTESHISNATNKPSEGTQYAMSPDSIPRHTNLTSETELQIRREPKWESYSDFIETKTCKCAKIALKQLLVHLPPYMKHLSPYVPPELPNYETCDVETLKILVNRANKRTSHVEKKRIPVTKDAFTQYSEQEFDFNILCTCFSLDKVSQFLAGVTCKKTKVDDVKTKFQLVDGSISSSSLNKSASSFAIANARGLGHLLDNDLELKEIFSRPTCD